MGILVGVLPVLILWAAATGGLEAQVLPETRPAAASRPAGWQRLPMPAGGAPGAVRDLLVGPSGELYAASDTKGLWRSADGGQTWQDIRSTDGGRSFKHTGNRLAGGPCST